MSETIKSTKIISMIRIDLVLFCAFMSPSFCSMTSSGAIVTGREDLARVVDTVVHNFYHVEFCVFLSVPICGLTFSVAAFLTAFNAGFC